MCYSECSFFAKTSLEIEKRNYRIFILKIIAQQISLSSCKEQAKHTQLTSSCGLLYQSQSNVQRDGRTDGRTDGNILFIRFPDVRTSHADFACSSSPSCKVSNNDSITRRYRQIARVLSARIYRVGHKNNFTTKTKISRERRGIFCCIFPQGMVPAILKISFIYSVGNRSYSCL